MDILKNEINLIFNSPSTILRTQSIKLQSTFSISKHPIYVALGNRSNQLIKIWLKSRPFHCKLRSILFIIFDCMVYELSFYSSSIGNT